MFVWVFCNPMDYSPPGFSVHGILQTRILEWVAISFYRESSWLKDQTLVSCIASGFFYHWAYNPCSRIKTYKIELQSQKLRLRDESLYISVITCLEFRSNAFYGFSGFYSYSGYVTFVQGFTQLFPIMFLIVCFRTVFPLHLLSIFHCSILLFLMQWKFLGGFIFL